MAASGLTQHQLGHLALVGDLYQRFGDIMTARANDLWRPDPRPALHVLPGGAALPPVLFRVSTVLEQPNEFAR